MARKGKLLAARDRESGRNVRLEKQRDQEKAARKRKRTLGEQLAAVAAGEGGEEGGVAVPAQEKEDDAVGEKDWEDEAEEAEEDDEDDDDDDEAMDEADEDGGIPLSDLDSVASDDKADVIPYQRLTINNTAALSASLRHLALPDALPFSTHQRISAATPTVIADVHDDLGRELAFYKQALDAALAGRRRLRKEGVAFTRPTDFFAEMVKSDEHMGKIRDKLTAKEQDRKASAEAKRQRDLKRFGKQVQVQKLQERDRQKRELKEKVNVLKRKRTTNNGDTTTQDDDLFDVALDTSKQSSKTRRPSSGSRVSSSGARTRPPPPNPKRQAKNDKYGSGGRKKFKKSGDAESSGDLRDFSIKRMKAGTTGTRGPAKRLGKSRRAKM